MSNYTFSSKLLNYVEAYKINGINKTKFFTEHDTNYKVGDVLYIMGGNYDIDLTKSNGYEILAIDNNNLWIVLNINYSGVLPYNEIDLDELTNVFLIDNTEKVAYENADNSFNFYIEDGKKYSMQNNSIFLSKILSLPNTTESHTYNRFFKSLETPVFVDNYTNKIGYLYSITASNINLLSIPTNILGTTASGSSDLSNGDYDISIAAYDSKTGLKSNFSTPQTLAISTNDEIEITFDHVSNADNYIISFSYSGLNKYDITNKNYYNVITGISDYKLGNPTYSLLFNNITDATFGKDIYNNNNFIYAVAKGTTYSTIWSHSYETTPLGSARQTISGTYYAITNVSNTPLTLGVDSYLYGLPVGIFKGIVDVVDNNNNHINGGFSYNDTIYNNINTDVFNDSGTDILVYDRKYTRNIFYSFGYKTELVSNIKLYIDFNLISSVTPTYMNINIYGYKYIKNSIGKINNIDSITSDNLVKHTSKQVLLATVVNVNANEDIVIDLNKQDYYHIYEINIEYTNSFTMDGEASGDLTFQNLVFSTNKSKTLNTVTNHLFNKLNYTSGLLTKHNPNYSNNKSLTIPLDSMALYILPLIPDGTGDPSTNNITKYHKLNYNTNYIEPNIDLYVPTPVILQGDVIPMLTTASNTRKHIEGNYETTLLHHENGIYCLSNDTETYMTYSSFYGLNINSVKLTGLTLSTWNTTYDSEFVEKVSIPTGYTATYTTNNLYSDNNTNSYFNPTVKKWDKYIITSDTGMYYLYLNFNPDTTTNKLSDIHRIYTEKITVSNPVLDYNSYIVKNINKFTYNNIQYFLGGNKGGGTFAAIINIGTTSALPFSHTIANGTAINSILYSEIENVFYIANNSGLNMIYNRTLNTNNVTLSTAVNTGNKLASNNISKLSRISNNYTDFIYSLTDKGLYRLSYKNDYTFNYFYSIDFDGGYTNLNSNVNRHNNIFISESFEYNGTQFKKGDVYTYNHIDREWLLDITYKTPYTTNALIKNAKFISVEWNNGIYGDYKFFNQLIATNSNFYNGVYINTNISGANFQSNSDSLKTFNYAKKSNNTISKWSDTLNNDGFGYNEFINSFIPNGTISNGVILNSYVGYTVSNNIYFNSLNNITSTYSNITINKAKLINTTINSVTISNIYSINSNHLNSDINNSTIISGDSINSHIKNSYVNNKGEIKILDYDVWTNLIDNPNNTSEIGLIYTYKFYIDENDLVKLQYGNKIKISNINSNKNLNYLNNNNLYMMVGTASDGFYTDVYEDIYSLKSYTHKILVSKRKSNQNNIKTQVNNNLKSVSSNTNAKQYASIDISFIRYFNKYSTLSEILKDNDYYFNITSINNAFINVNEFETTYLENNTIEYISDINDKNLIFDATYSRLNIRILSTSSFSATYSRNLSLNTFKVGDILNIDNVTFKTQNQIVNINNYFTVNTYSANNITFGATLSNNVVFGTAAYLNQYATFSSTIAKNIYTHKNVLKYNKILDGIYSGSELKYNIFSGTNLIYLYNIVQSNDTNTYSNNVLHVRSYIDNSISKGGNYENSIFYNSDIYKTITNNTAIINSTVSNSIVNNSNINTTIPSVGSYSYNALIVNSTLISSTVSGSDILRTNMIGGKLNKSLFMGNLLNGTTVNDSNITQGILYSMTFNSGNIGYNTKYIKDINLDLYKRGSNIWDLGFSTVILNNSTINGGVISSGEYNGYSYINGNFATLSTTYSLTTTWNSGVVNNALVVKKVRWVGGTFKNGNFQSDYGDNITTYAWENGVFEGSIFGDGSNIATGWKNGVFNSGIFKGKVWNSGVFVKGSFEGSGLEIFTYSVSDYVHGALNPPEFMYSYNNTNNFYGLWRDGIIQQTNGNTDISKSDSVSLLQKNRYRIEQQSTATFKNMLFVRGTISNANAVIENSVLLSGVFESGEFKYSNFNPFTERIRYDIATSSKVWSADISSYSVWNGGLFNSSIFNISNFNGGKIIGGINPLTNKNDQRYNVIIGAHIKNTTIDYANIYNSILEKSNFKNGNWYGSPLSNSIKGIPALEYLNNSYVPYNITNFGSFTYSNNKYYQYLLINNFERYAKLNNTTITTANPHLWNSINTENVYTSLTYVGNWSTYSDTVNSTLTSGSFIGFDDFLLHTYSIMGYSETMQKISTTLNSGSVSYNKQHTIVSNTDYTTYSNYWTTTANTILTPTSLVALTYSDTFEFRIGTISIPEYTNIKLFYEKLNNTYVEFASYGSGAATVSYNANKYLLKWDLGSVIPTKPKIKIVVNNTLFNNSGFVSDVKKNIGFNLVYQVYTASISSSYSIYNNTLASTISWTKNEQPNNSNISYYAFSSFSYSVSTFSVLTGVMSENITFDGKSEVVRTQIGNGTIIKNNIFEGVYHSGINNFKSFYNKSDTIIADQVSCYRIDNNTLNLTIYIPIATSDIDNSYVNVLDFFTDDNATNDIPYGTKPILTSLMLSISNISIYDINGRRNTISDILVGSLDVNRKSRYISKADLKITNYMGGSYYSISTKINDRGIGSTILKSSEKHLIQITKKIFKKVTILNGLMEGLYTNSIIDGFPNTLSFNDTHLINTDFRGGRFISRNIDYTSASYSATQSLANTSFAFETGISLFESLVDDTLTPYKINDTTNKVNTSLIQNMIFSDGLILDNNLIPQLGQVYERQYLYKTDFQLIWDKNVNVNIFDLNLYNFKGLSKYLLQSDMVNLPIGASTLDVIESTSTLIFEKGVTLDKYAKNIIWGDYVKYEIKQGINNYDNITTFECDFLKNPIKNGQSPNKYIYFNMASYSLNTYAYTASNLTSNSNSNYVYGTVSDNGLQVLIPTINSYAIGGNYTNTAKTNYKKIEYLVEIPSVSLSNINPNFTLATTSNIYLDFGQHISSATQSFIFNTTPIYDYNNNTVKTGLIKQTHYIANNYGGGFRNEIFINNKNLDTKFYNIKETEINVIPFFNIWGTTSQWNGLNTNARGVYKFTTIPNTDIAVIK